MLIPSIRVLALVLSLAAASHSALLAQSHDHDHDHDHEHTTELLAYRAPEWVQLQFTNPQLAQQHLAAVQQLGCEAQTETSAGTTTVSYRCEEWKPLELANHELAEQWEAWLKGAKFDCSHGHVDPALLEGPEVVEFRQTEWQTAHVEAEEVEGFVDTLTKIGCEVDQSEDGDHIDVSFRAPLWSDIHLPDHESAEQWVTWLEAHAFEVRHEHEDE